VKLYEFEGKGLFARAGIRVPRGVVASSPDEAAAAAELGRVMVKAQTLWGSRGKRGLIRRCANAEEAAQAAAELLGTAANGETVTKVLVEEQLEAAVEGYLAVTYIGRKPAALVSRRGGVDIEAVGRDRPSDVLVEPIHILRGLEFEQAESLVKRVGFGQGSEHVAGVLLRLYHMFIEDDAVLAEINPLIGTPADAWYAADAKVEIDDEALYRLGLLRLPSRLGSGREPTELERLALENDRRDSRGAAGRMFYELPEGNIVILASGGGTSVEALDDLYLLGGRPAVFTEYSGNPTGEKVAGLTRIALQYPGPIDAVWVIGGRANFTDIHETLVNGVMAGIREAPGFDKTTPIIIRRAGPRDEEAFDALRTVREREGYNLFLRGMATSVVDSARMVIRQAKRHADARSGEPQ